MNLKKKNLQFLQVLFLLYCLKNNLNLFFFLLLFFVSFQQGSLNIARNL